MFRSFVAILVGYLVMAISTVATVMLLDSMFATDSSAGEGHRDPSTPAILLNLLSGVICASAGGFVTTLIAARKKIEHTLAFAAIVFILGVAYAIQMRSGPQPGWYLTVLPVCGAVGVMIGGTLGSRWLRSKPLDD